MSTAVTLTEQRGLTARVMPQPLPPRPNSTSRSFLLRQDVDHDSVEKHMSTFSSEHFSFDTIFIVATGKADFAAGIHDRRLFSEFLSVEANECNLSSCRLSLRLPVMGEAAARSGEVRTSATRKCTNFCARVLAVELSICFSIPNLGIYICTFRAHLFFQLELILPSGQLRASLVGR